MAYFPLREKMLCVTSSNRKTSVHNVFVEPGVCCWGSNETAQLAYWEG